MGNDCFNFNNKEKDLLVKKKFQREQENHPYNEINQNNIYHYNTPYKFNNYPLAYDNNNYQYFPPNNNDNFQKSLLGKRSNSLKIIDNQKPRRIHKFTREELEDEINDILRVRIPFFNNDILKTISAFTFLSGNGPYHEGLMFFTTNKNFYIAQSYPITFIKVYDFYAGISEIISFNNLNSGSKKYNIPEIYMPQQRITLFNVLNIINNIPNSYNLLNDNCQDFCNNILESLQNKYRIDIDDSPSKEKLNFLKKQQKKAKLNKIPHGIVSLYGSGRFGK